MMSTHKKPAHEDKEEATHSAAGGAHKAKPERTLTITCDIGEDVADDDAHKMRQEVETYLKTYLPKRMGKALKALKVQ
jgi:hypothetical protein